MEVFTKENTKYVPESVLVHMNAEFLHRCEKYIMEHTIFFDEAHYAKRKEELKQEIRKEFNID